MKKFIYPFLLIFFMASVLVAQNRQNVSLKECLQKAVENFPNEKQINYNQESHQIKEKILNKNFLPSLNLNGQASHQSAVTNIPALPIPGITLPVVSKNWYKINLDLEQLIWDGGMTSRQKTLETSNYHIADQQVKIKVYKLKQRVSVLYFNILFQQESLKTLYILLGDLNSRIQEAMAAVTNGALLPSDADVLKVSQMQAKQLIIQKQEDLKGLLAAMNELTGLDIQSAGQLSTPKITLRQYPFEDNRPEYQLLNLQQDKIQVLKSLSSAKRMPIFKAFGQAGYGRPGYNLLNNHFSTYYIVGFQLRWNIWDWNKVKQEKQEFSLQKNIIESEKETFNQNLRVGYKKQLAAIEKFKKLIRSDQEIVTLQENIVKTAQNKLKNGTITPTDYLIQLNKKIKAILTREAHQLQLLFAKYQYITIVGNL